MTHPNTIRPTEELVSSMKGAKDRLWVLKHFPEKFTPGDAEELWKLIEEAVHIRVGMYEDAPGQVKQILKPIKDLYDEHLINAGKASQNSTGVGRRSSVLVSQMVDELRKPCI